MNVQIECEYASLMSRRKSKLPSSCQFRNLGFPYVEMDLIFQLLELNDDVIWERLWP